MTPYDPRRWTSHLFDIEGSMVREILGRVMVSVVCATLVVLLSSLDNNLLKAISIPLTPHTLLGTVLGLLLVFRTNSSYDRFWEGRKQWGSIVNETRNLARQSSVWLAADPRLVQEVIDWVIIFPYSVVQRLRGDAELKPHSRILSEADEQKVKSSLHPPLAIARLITAKIKQAKEKGLIDSLQLAAMDQNVQQLIDYCGACERIRWTPIPFAYAVHLRRVLILYCMTLPLALAKDFGWSTIPVTLLVSYALFGIEEIGVEIEDPFGYSPNDLPIENFCKGIETILADVRDQAGVS